MPDNQLDLLIIYTSKNGRTGSMVEPIRQGILDSGASATVRTVQEVQWDKMLAAKGIIVGTPVRFGGVDWQIKQLFDITALQDYPGPLSGKVGGAFTGGGGPGGGAELAMLSMLHILLNHGMVIQGNAHSSHYGPVALRESPRDEVVSVCNARLGTPLGRLGSAAVRELLDVYTGITASCSSRPFSTRNSICRA